MNKLKSDLLEELPLAVAAVVSEVELEVLEEGVDVLLVVLGQHRLGRLRVREHRRQRLQHEPKEPRHPVRFK